MGVHILSDGENDVMYCSTSDWAIGPVMIAGMGEVFIAWLRDKGRDPRVESCQLERWYLDFRIERDCECGSFFAIEKDFDEDDNETEKLVCQRCGKVRELVTA